MYTSVECTGTVATLLNRDAMLNASVSAGTTILNIGDAYMDRGVETIPVFATGTRLSVGTEWATVSSIESASTITVTANLLHDHPIYTPVLRWDYFDVATNLSVSAPMTTVVSTVVATGDPTATTAEAVFTRLAWNGDVYIIQNGNLLRRIDDASFVTIPDPPADMYGLFDLSESLGMFNYTGVLSFYDGTGFSTIAAAPMDYANVACNVGGTVYVFGGNDYGDDAERIVVASYTGDTWEVAFTDDTGGEIAYVVPAPWGYFVASKNYGDDVVAQYGRCSAYTWDGVATSMTRIASLDDYPRDAVVVGTVGYISTTSGIYAVGETVDLVAVPNKVTYMCPYEDGAFLAECSDSGGARSRVSYFDGATITHLIDGGAAPDFIPDGDLIQDVATIGDCLYVACYATVGGGEYYRRYTIETETAGGSGTIRIGMEPVMFSSITSGTDYNRYWVDSRGTNAYPHTEWAPVFDAQYTLDNPQPGTAMATYGVIEDVDYHHGAMDQNSLDLRALEKLMAATQPQYGKVEMAGMDVWQDATYSHKKDITYYVDSATKFATVRFHIHTTAGTDSATQVYLGDTIQKTWWDIRFATTGLTPYYLATFGTQSATVWVKIRDPATGGATLSMYWGSPMAIDYTMNATPTGYTVATLGTWGAVASAGYDIGDRGYALVREGDPVNVVETDGASRLWTVQGMIYDQRAGTLTMDIGKAEEYGIIQFAKPFRTLDIVSTKNL